MKYMSKAYILVTFISFSLGAMNQPLERQSNDAYKRDLQAQQQTIKDTLRQAIDSLAQSQGQESAVADMALSRPNWLMPPVCKAVVDAQVNALTSIVTAKPELTVVSAGYDNPCVTGILEKLLVIKHITKTTVEKASTDSVDIILAPHTLYGEMEAIFKASEGLLRNDSKLPIEEHPLFKYFEMLSKNGAFIVTLNSGPTIQDFTHIVLGKHELELTKVDQDAPPKLKIFNTVETFFRCLDIFKKYYREKTGKVIICDLSFSSPHIPLDIFCLEYVKQYPELRHMNAEQLEKFVRLLSVFAVGKDIVDLSITLKMSIEETGMPIQQQRSFKPIPSTSLEQVKPGTAQSGSTGNNNEISLGQQNLDKQIQNLDGSELSMVHIKDADGAAQLEALQSIIGHDDVNIVDLGGGRGETNALMKAIQDQGTKVHLLNVEPYKPFKDLYLDAQKTVGVTDVQVWEQTAQELSAANVIKHFKDKKVDVIYASHSFYFLLGDLYKASLASMKGSTSILLAEHPLWKYFDMLHEKGVFVITMQSGAGARLFRNALLGNHGLNQPASNVADETVPLLSSFGNMATLLRHFELFAERYQKETGKIIIIKMHYSVANVPLGSFTISKDSETGGYGIQHMGSSELASKMLDFYGNWNELQKLATLTPEKVMQMDPEAQKKLGLENATPEAIAAKRETARKTQETFLHILRVFAPAKQNMQHPNITLEISVQPKQ